MDVEHVAAFVREPNYRTGGLGVFEAHTRPDHDLCHILYAKNDRFTDFGDLVLSRERAIRAALRSVMGADRAGRAVPDRVSLQFVKSKRNFVEFWEEATVATVYYRPEYLSRKDIKVALDELEKNVGHKPMITQISIMDAKNMEIEVLHHLQLGRLPYPERFVRAVLHDLGKVADEMMTRKYPAEAWERQVGSQVDRKSQKPVECPRKVTQFTVFAYDAALDEVGFGCCTPRGCKAYDQ